MTVLKYMNIVMSVVYIAFGVFMLWQSPDDSGMLKDYGLPLGIALIAYGVFRGYRTYQKFFQNKIQDDQK